MAESVTTQKHLGIIPSTWGGGEGKFRDLRHSAHDDYVERRQKAKRNKKEKVPKYHPGQIVVICRNSNANDRQYALCEIIDFEEDPIGSDFEYYAIILKTTQRSQINRIGRLMKIQASWFHREKILGQFDEETSKIKWLETGQETPQ